MKYFLLSTTKRIIRALIYLTLGGLIALLAVFVIALEKRPDLNIWHETELDAEFTTESPVADISDYIKLEEKLFRQLEEKVYNKIGPEERHLLNRFFGHQGTIGRHHHSESFIGSITGKIEDVRSKERFSTCEDDDGFADGGDLIHHPQAFLSGEFPWVRASLCGGTAVDTGEVAASRELPRNHSQRMIRYR